MKKLTDDMENEFMEHGLVATSKYEHNNIYKSLHYKSRIINGKKYDIETAECLIGADNGVDPSSCDDYEYVALYRKSTGEYFLYKIIHNFSDYDMANGTTVQTYFEPFRSEDKAKKYCVENLSVEDYEKIFGEVAE